MITAENTREKRWVRLSRLVLKIEGSGLPWNVGGEQRSACHAQIWKDNDGSDDIRVDRDDRDILKALEECAVEAKEKGWLK